MTIQSEQKQTHFEINNNEQRTVKRSLKTRHVSMIAIGGCIGTGLFMASGEAIHSAGPVGALIGYALIGLMVYFLMTSLGEMTTHLPITGAFNIHASRFVDPALGFALGWNYWFSWVVTVVADVMIAAVVLRYWEPLQFLQPWQWSMLIFALIMGLNLLQVKFYGESEYWLSIIKVLTVIVFIAVGLLTIFGILGGEYIGGKNFFTDKAILGDGAANKFLMIFGVFLIAGFSFQGTEIIGITAGESENPSETIPKATKQIFWRILIFYILAIAVIGFLIPHNSPDLLGADANQISKSPFTLVFEKAGFALAASIMNAVILTSIFSAGNSGMYTSSRMLFAMGKNKQAHPIFGKLTKNGVPVNAVIGTGIVVLVLFLLQSQVDSAEKYIIAASGTTGFIIWLGIAVSHYRFRRAFIAQKIPLSQLTYKAKYFPFGPIMSFVLCALVIIGQDADLILKGNFDLKGFMITYMGLPIFAIFYIYYKIRYKTKLIPLNKVDLSRE